MSSMQQVKPSTAYIFISLLAGLATEKIPKVREIQVYLPPKFPTEVLSSWRSKSEENNFFLSFFLKQTVMICNDLSKQAPIGHFNHSFDNLLKFNLI